MLKLKRINDPTRLTITEKNGKLINKPQKQTGDFLDIIKPQTGGMKFKPLTRIKPTPITLKAVVEEVPETIKKIAKGMANLLKTDKEKVEEELGIWKDFIPTTKIEGGYIVGKYASFGMGKKVFTKDLTQQQIQSLEYGAKATQHEKMEIAESGVIGFSGRIQFIKGLTAPMARDILKVSKTATEKQISMAFKKKLHDPKISKEVMGLSEKSGLKTMEVLTEAKNLLLKKVVKPIPTKPLLLKKIEPTKTFTRIKPEAVKPTIKPITKETDIITEARKYKSVDEFVEAQGKNLRLFEQTKFREIWHKANPRIIKEKVIDKSIQQLKTDFQATNLIDGRNIKNVIKQLPEPKIGTKKQNFIDAFPKVYHGTLFGKETKTGLSVKHDLAGYDGLFFTTNKEVAKTYADPKNRLYIPSNWNISPSVRQYNVVLDNPKVIDWKGKVWHGTKDIIKQAKKEGHDGIIIKNVIDTYDAKNKIVGDNIIAFSNKAIKTKSQLTDIYNKATKPITKGKEAVAKPVEKPVKKIVEVKSVLPKAKVKGVIRETTGQVKQGMTAFKQRMTDLVRGLREGRILTKNEIQTTQTEIIDILDKSKLERSDKAKFIRAIKNVQTTEQLKKVLPKIQDRISILKTRSTERTIIKAIEKEFKYTKPIKQGQKQVAKFDYQTNKLLENLRYFNKLTQEKAEIKLNEMPQENLSEIDKIKTRLLSLKANGAKASIILHEQVLADIINLKRIGIDAKNEADFLKKIEKQIKIDDVLSGIEKQKETWKIFKGLKTSYVSSIANLYSTINTIAGKGIADKYDYGMFQTNSRADFSNKTDKMAKKVKEIYNIKKDSHLNYLFINELNNQNFTMIDNNGFKESISRFNLMNIYNGLKNDLIRERYYNAFGETQINSLLQNLTQEDIKLANELMQEVQEYKEILNQRSIEITGRDMGSIENYWPSVSEFQAEFFDDVKIQGETPSAMKKRAVSSKIIPKTANAWLIFQKHIAQAEHIKTVSRKYEEIKRIFSDRRIEKTIKKKYGDTVYYTLMEHIDTFSLNKRTEAIDTFSGIYNIALNNWVKAKIVSPTVFARQLISSIYSIDEVGYKNFLKYNIARNPRKAFHFMWSKVPFVKNRFRRGHSEALQDVMSGANNLKIQTDGITRYTTLLVRGGDITGVVANGYPIIQTELAKNNNMEKAVEKFQKFTEKTQQSPSPANLSQLQRQRNAFARTFLRFKNTLNQLLRLQIDATIQFRNKQITAKQFATKTALYSIYTPMMYVLIGFAIKEGLKGLAGNYDEEEEESLLGNILQNMIIQPFQAIPLLDATTDVAYSEIRKRITGKTYYSGQGLFSYPLLDDITRAWSISKKKEPSASDFLKVFSLLQEPTTGIPTETLLRYYGYITEEKDEPKTFEEKQREKELKEIEKRRGGKLREGKLREGKLR